MSEERREAAQELADRQAAGADLDRRLDDLEAQQRRAGADVMRLSAALADLERRAAGGEQVSAATSAETFAVGAPERAGARRVEQQLGELRSDPRTAVAAHHGWTGEITLDDALAIRDGQLELDGALERGGRRRAEQRGGMVVSG